MTILRNLGYHNIYIQLISYKRVEDQFISCFNGNYNFYFFYNIYTTAETKNTHFQFQVC